MLIEQTGGDIQAAMKPLSWDSCLQMFVSTGISPRETELACSEWLTDLIGGPLVDYLRHSDDMMQILLEALGHAKNLIISAKVVFSDVSAMHAFTQTVAALLILLEALSLRRFQEAPATAAGDQEGAWGGD